MKFLFDLFPVILFFAAFKAFDIFVATGVVIAATAGQIAWVWHRHGKVDTMLWISLGLVVVFGGATLILHDNTFIKWKPTVLYWIFAGVLLFSDMVLRKNLIRKMLAEQIALPDPLWKKLNLSWVSFFAALGVANLYFSNEINRFIPSLNANFTEDTWVNFKLFGGMGLMIVFIVIQGMVLAKYIPEENQ